MTARPQFDYIVVGGGSAGCVLASRLSEDPETQVLLLEAGSTGRPEFTDVPPAWPMLMGSPIDWGGSTVPQDGADGLVVPWPRGRGLGGSSSINAMCFLRGHRSSYDAWEKSGAHGWTYDSLLPYFKRSEDVTGVPDRDPAYRGTAGPLKVGPARERHPLAEAFLAAAAETGRPQTGDFTAGLEAAFGWGDLSIHDGRRQDAAAAYLSPALERPNLHVVTGALVHGIVIEDGRCTGVEYGFGSEVLTALSSRETLLTAGAVGTAQLLMLSGIGPEDHLRELGIPVVVARDKVGENLQDHPMCGVVYAAACPVPPAVNNHGEAQGLICTQDGLEGPDIQLQMVDVPLREDSLPGPDMGAGYTLMVSLMTPSSRGTVRLADRVPGSAPVIDPQYYTHPDDVAATIAGLRAARSIGAAPALAPWCGEEALPGSAAQSDAELAAYVRTNLRSYGHYTGTCRMGSDENAVVDTELRVRGIAGLRVADASVMPSIVSANTNATVYAVAERAADLVRGR